MKEEMHYGGDYGFIPAVSVKSGDFTEVRPDVSYYVNQIVNVIFIRTENGFVLVDAGMPRSKDRLFEVIEENFGSGPPECILLTHGHFDHVGSIVDLLEEWPEVPVYAHPLELPYLTGERDYPEPDPSVEGGLIAKVSGFFPNEAIDISGALRPLPDNGEVPGLGEFRWIHTPGHSEGHVSFYREKDGLLLAGDAFVTVRQDSLYEVLIQHKKISGPPRYFTTDWQKAQMSVEALRDLGPSVVITGHGPAAGGTNLREGLDRLAEHFQEVAVPDHGRYS
ncbi:MBL fold metallo-hydrolase [Alteribacter natronophilus]|uniref:MBL fold metallo-hydrolase n=1 Tax=Alteribacter natronophilus TaxID=2583810 RepID=UPI001FE99172|nr:MBL fold metallo-hydrolase [Alteribacter natronophilus]